MKKLAFLLLSLVLIGGMAHAYSERYIQGYFRDNGTYVRGHFRSVADGDKWNNRSSHDWDD